jgi:hypothetical protein
LGDQTIIELQNFRIIYDSIVEGILINFTFIIIKIIENKSIFLYDLTNNEIKTSYAVFTTKMNFNYLCGIMSLIIKSFIYICIHNNFKKN